MLPNQDEMKNILISELDNLPKKHKEFIESRMFSLRKKTLEWDYSRADLEIYECWAFAEIAEFQNQRFVGAAYCKGGFGAMGNPWGLIWLNDDIGSFGMDSGWFKNLEQLINEWL